MYSQKLKNWNNELSPSPTKYNNVSEPTFGDLRISREKKYFMLMVEHMLKENPQR